MKLRREFLYLAGAAVPTSSVSGIVKAQTEPGTPKVTQILRKDLEGQGQVVKETVVLVGEFGPGIGIPWHMHPGAQEVLYVQEGSLMVEVEGKGTTAIKAGECYLIPAEVPHRARNESATVSAKSVVIYSRSDKDKPLLVPVKKAT
jgi:quercetin dioxygenase-like cupin family protein